MWHKFESWSLIQWIRAYATQVSIPRDCISRGQSVKYLTADEVIDYIKENNLYTRQKEDDPINDWVFTVWESCGRKMYIMYGEEEN